MSITEIGTKPILGEIRGYVAASQERCGTLEHEFHSFLSKTSPCQLSAHVLWEGREASTRAPN